MDTLHPQPPAGNDRPAVSRRDLVVLLVAAACLQAVAWAVLLALFSAGAMGYGLHQLGDGLLYQQYAGLFLMGKWPYAGVPVEYPPLANLVFLVSPSGGTVAEYERWFSVAMLAATTGAAVLSTAAAALAWRSVARGFTTAVAYAVLTLCCGALALNRYDAVVALVVAAALFFLAVRRWLPAAVSLGVGFALKLTPALLLPLVLLLQESRRRFVVVLAGFVVAAALPFIPFLIHDPGTAGYPFSYHAGRPLQIESVPGTPWAAATLFGAAHPRIVSDFGSQNFSGGGASTWSPPCRRGSSSSPSARSTPSCGGAGRSCATPRRSSRWRLWPCCWSPSARARSSPPSSSSGRSPSSPSASRSRGGCRASRPSPWPLRRRSRRWSSRRATGTSWHCTTARWRSSSSAT